MITREEYELLKEHREIGYKWLVRNKNKELIAYKTLPKKFSLVWRVDNGSPSPILIGGRADDILNYVTWEDEEPTNIDDLISDYESHQVITGESVNKTELVKEIEGILDDIGVSDYQLGECDEDTIWTISSITIREILSAIEKCCSIEKEKLYTVTLSNGSFLIKDPEFNTFQLCIAPKEQIEGYEYKLTQSEIESVDPVLMQIAKAVE